MAAYVPYNHKDMSEDEDTYIKNVKSCTKILEFAIKFRVKRFIMISSIDVYGKPNQKVVTEKTICKPINIYGLAKLACEKISYTFSFVNDLNVSIVRFGPIVGPNMSKNLKIFKMVSDLLSGKEVIIQDCDSYVSFLSEEDAAEAIIKVYEKEEKFSIYNISGAYVKIKYLFRGFIKKNDIKFNAEFRYEKKTKNLIIFSNKKAKENLNWKPSPDFKNIVNSFLLSRNS